MQPAAEHFLSHHTLLAHELTQHMMQVSCLTTYCVLPS